MIERLRKTLVESFVAAIALGWLFAEGILHFANIFSAPVALWLARREYRGFVGHPPPTGFPLQDALPELVKCIAILVVAYLLLRWLYFKPAREGTKPAPEISA